ncbi:DUF4143 domain-containing protein [Parashewanella curva]|uniref:DUF4143 domain-containing protein n=1 Tax=Parashewanella curva TaxID=2338552 RepID=A0A3L8PRC8_9GAMM|nr:AAA family ATPase [Parashewanella curva]RLV57947.1 DUF4143 domain-containing protein [Parashewanella curva]
MYFYRNIDTQLLNWKQSELRKPALIYGARQVGKSSALKKFGETNYRKVFEINFMKMDDADSIFNDGKDIGSIIKNIQFYLSDSFDPAQDLIVFEEVGFSEKALTTLKFFSEDAPEIHIVATGSNIGLYRSFPVGKVEWMPMYPMTFSEFLKATGNEVLTDAAELPVDQSVPEIAHQKLMSCVQDYWFVGGMPEAVEAWVSYPVTQPLERVRAVDKVQADLIKGYETDFGKLSKDHEVSTLKLKRIYASMARQIASEEDGNTPKFKFKGTLGNTSVRYEDVVEPIDFLRDLMVVHKVHIFEGINASYNMDFQVEENKFKLLPHDVGILTKMIGVSYQDILRGKDAYKGFIAEVFVANEMISAMVGNSRIELNSFKRGNTSEIEFLFEKQGGFIPVEVKSGKSIRSKSLNAFVERFSPKFALKFTANNVKNSPERVIQQLALYRARHAYRECFGDIAEEKELLSLMIPNSR